MAGNIDKLIINSPHQEPQQHWFYDERIEISSSKKEDDQLAMLWPRQTPKPLMILEFL